MAPSRQIQQVVCKFLQVLKTILMATRAPFFGVISLCILCNIPKLQAQFHPSVVLEIVKVCKEVIAVLALKLVNQLS